MKFIPFHQFSKAVLDQLDHLVSIANETAVARELDTIARAGTEISSYKNNEVFQTLTVLGASTLPNPKEPGETFVVFYLTTDTEEPMFLVADALTLLTFISGN